MKRILKLSFVCLLACCRQPVEIMECRVVAEHPHDVNCYTQGLEFSGRRMLESGGHYGRSKLRWVNPADGSVIRERALPASIFAEGLTLLHGELWLLTWKEKVAYVFQPETLELIRRHACDGEGWGLTNDGEHLVMSDGSSRLTFRDPANFAVVNTVEVTENGNPLERINELEWVNGSLWANIYQADRLVRINPKTGKVTGTIDAKELRRRLPVAEVPAEELNGIAHDPVTGHLWVTGKFWPTMFELDVPTR